MAACADDDANRAEFTGHSTRATRGRGDDSHSENARIDDSDHSSERGRDESADTGPQSAVGIDVDMDMGNMDQGPLTADPGRPISDLDGGVDDDAGLGWPGMPFPRTIDCEGKRGAPGTTVRMWNDRAYIVHIPPAASPNTALPVMLVFHGAGGTGAQMQAATGFDIAADQVGIITIYPDGKAGNAPWNVGRNVCPPGNFVSTTDDDIAYVDAMLEEVKADQCVDDKRIFATGFSMGGYMSNELGCRIGRTTLRAVAPHSGGTHSGDCPGAPLPVLLLHGDSDSLINYSCGTRAHDYWIERNGCSDEVDRIDITGGHCDYNKGCPADAPVVMCTFNGLDHAWAYPPMYENSGILIWLFFSQFK
jgi:polyhydroxybutyrate depolymerase